MLHKQDALGYIVCLPKIVVFHVKKRRKQPAKERKAREFINKMCSKPPKKNTNIFYLQYLHTHHLITGSTPTSTSIFLLSEVTNEQK